VASSHIVFSVLAVLRLSVVPAVRQRASSLMRENRAWQLAIFLAAILLGGMALGMLAAAVRGG
jgi:hypothetical protein